MKLSDYVANFLGLHTSHVFVGQGSTIVHILDSLSKTPNIEIIPCENEQGSSIAAEAYTRVSGKLGVAIATSGPGIMNMLQGIACAYYDSIPCLFISGAPPTSQLKGTRIIRQVGFQEMDVVEIVKPITKYAVLVTDPKNIRYELEKLVHIAKEGRPGPVLLDLPDDLQRTEINPEELYSYVPTQKIDIILTPLVNKITDYIKNSNRPVIIIGSGVKLGKAEDKIKKFLCKTKIPYLTTWATIDMFLDDEPNLIGNFGVSANRYGNFAVQNSDLIISFGSRLDTHQTGSNPSKFAPNAKKIIIDIDNAELNKNNGMIIDLKLNYNVNTVLDALNSKDIKAKDLTSWKAIINNWKVKYPICHKEYYDQKERVNPYVFMNELSKKTKENSIITTDTGANITWFMQAYKMRTHQKIIGAYNHSTMGYALPASIGVQYALPDKQVMCITGDGGLQMNIQELETIAFNELPIKIFVIDNNEYGMIKQTQDTWLKSRYVASDPSSGLGFPDFCKIADAYGIKSITIYSHADLITKIKYVLNYNKPILCNVKINSGAKIIPKLEFGRPIEDLSPLLPREELHSNML